MLVSMTAIPLIPDVDIAFHPAADMLSDDAVPDVAVLALFEAVYSVLSVSNMITAVDRNSLVDVLGEGDLEEVPQSLTFQFVVEHAPNRSLTLNVNLKNAKFSENPSDFETFS